MSLCETQFLNKVIKDKDYSLFDKYSITGEHFTDEKPVYDFIKSFYSNNNCIPDVETVIDKFGNYQYFDVNQSIESIVNDMNEQLLFRRAVTIFNDSSKLFENNSFEGARYLLKNIDKLQLTSLHKFTDIAHNKENAYKTFEEKQDNFSKYFIASGFPELDARGLFGWMRGDELAIITSRNGNGKTFVLVKSAVSAFEDGLNVGIVSPELTVNMMAERMYSTDGKFDLSKLMFGGKLGGFKEYLDELDEHENKFFVATTEEFGDTGCTVSALESFCTICNIDILYIDGVDYLEDERGTSSEANHEKLGHIAQDLLKLSRKLNIPVILVVQTNRRATERADGVIGTENLAGSDKLAHSATRVITIQRNKDDNSILELEIIKNRYGKCNSETRCIYKWDASTNQYFYIKNLDDITVDVEAKEEAETMKKDMLSVF